MVEGLVHIAMRRFLKHEGWTLIAGEYPGGSDDELYVLRIKNPNLARDNSPDPRRHSFDEYVPDLLAFKDHKMLIIEAKPAYSLADKEKLRELLTRDYLRLIQSLGKFCREHHLLTGVDLNEISYIPTLAFGNPTFKKYSEEPGFAHIYVKTPKEVRMIYFGD